MVLCVAASLAAHALLLTVVGKPKPMAPSVGHPGSASAAVKAALTSPAGRSLPAAMKPRALPAEPLPAATATAEQASNPESAGPSSSTLPGNDGQDEFIPRPLLTAPPVAQAPVILVAPPGETQIARHVAILALYIDEQGQVRRVSASDPPLPPALEQAAREAFLAARFAPGQIDGRAVKSRIRVEVVFDNTPLR